MWMVYSLIALCLVPFAVLMLVKADGWRIGRRIRATHAAAADARAIREARLADLKRDSAELLEASAEYQTAFAQARQKLDELKARARTNAERRRLLDAGMELLRISKGDAQPTAEGYREQAEAISEFTRKADWLVPRR